MAHPGLKIANFEVLGMGQSDREKQGAVINLQMAQFDAPQVKIIHKNLELAPRHNF
jgi:hypothetical protein